MAWFRVVDAKGVAAVSSVNLYKGLYIPASARSTRGVRLSWICIGWRHEVTTAWFSKVFKGFQSDVTQAVRLTRGTSDLGPDNNA